MPSRLKRRYGLDDLHFVTCSCYRRRPLLANERARDVFLRIFEQVRRKYRFEVVGYVVMPEHFHILIGEPYRGDPSKGLAGAQAEDRSSPARTAPEAKAESTGIMERGIQGRASLLANSLL